RLSRGAAPGPARERAAEGDGKPRRVPFAGRGRGRALEGGAGRVASATRRSALLLQCRAGRRVVVRDGSRRAQSLVERRAPAGGAWEACAAFGATTRAGDVVVASARRRETPLRGAFGDLYGMTKVRARGKGNPFAFPFL